MQLFGGGLNVIKYGMSFKVKTGNERPKIIVGRKRDGIIVLQYKVGKQ